MKDTNVMKRRIKEQVRALHTEGGKVSQKIKIKLKINTKFIHPKR